MELTPGRRPDPPCWWRFGRWPSAHDLDLVLDARGYDATRLVGGLDIEEGNTTRTVAVAELALPAGLLTEAVTVAEGVPLDLFLRPEPARFSIAAWLSAPYHFAEIGWRPTLDKRFFGGLVPLAPDLIAEECLVTPEPPRQAVTSGEAAVGTRGGAPRRTRPGPARQAEGRLHTTVTTGAGKVVS